MVGSHAGLLHGYVGINWVATNVFSRSCLAACAGYDGDIGFGKKERRAVRIVFGWWVNDV